jgi:RNA-directed DNA polymerase
MLNTSVQSRVSAALPLTEWNSIPWIKLQRHVRKLQQRIYREESLGNKRKVKELQRLLMRSKSALLLSIKQVTQINKGKRTAGVDGYKALTPQERNKLYKKLITYNVFSHRPKPSRRTYIQKKEKGKLRPLGIPVIIDRVYQNVTKLALEPQWEVHFEPISYGFRPKRSQHDAVESIFLKIKGNTRRKWVFEGDFKGCFDNLNHDFILEQLIDFPAKKLIQKWLKAGFVDNNVFEKTETGTPQGGVISPLLANIALHGMEEELGIEYYTSISKNGNRSVKKKAEKRTLAMVRYADDFLIFCQSREEAESIYHKLVPYLNNRGLELAKEKTRVVHVTEGFDFLGFTFKHYPTKKSKGKSWKLIIKPSRTSQAKFKGKIKEIFERNVGGNVAKLISDLNPVIRGTANYWKTVNSKETFVKIDNYIFWKVVRFLNKLHPHKTAEWKKKRYFKPDIHGISKDTWILTDPVGMYQLTKMAWTPAEPHEMVKLNFSPFNKDLNDYYAKRDIKLFNKDNIASKQKLAKQQKHTCPLCGTSIISGEGLEVHHKTPRVKGGKDTYLNLALVHISCHTLWHKAFPAKGETPTEIQTKAFKKMLRRVQTSK